MRCLPIQPLPERSRWTQSPLQPALGGNVVPCLGSRDGRLDALRLEKAASADKPSSSVSFEAVTARQKTALQKVAASRLRMSSVGDAMAVIPMTWRNDCVVCLGPSAPLPEAA